MKVEGKKFAQSNREKLRWRRYLKIQISIQNGLYHLPSGGIGNHRLIIYIYIQVSALRKHTGPRLNPMLRVPCCKPNNNKTPFQMRPRKNKPTTLQQTSSNNPTQRYSPRHLLHTLPRLQNSLAGRQKQTLTRRPKPLDRIPLMAPHNIPKLRYIKRQPPRRLANQRHLGNDRFALPVLQPQPEPARGYVFPRHGLDGLDLIVGGRDLEEDVLGWWVTPG